MSNTQVIPPVRRQVVVNASAEHAFEVFTDGVDRWWPREHHIGASPLKRAIIEPHQDGRWYATNEDGTEVNIGKVLVWDPPRRLVLAWQITAKWQYDPDFVTEVEVTFTAEGPGRTVVDLEHRDLERYGVEAVDLRKSIDSEGGWVHILNSFVLAAES